MIQVSVKDALHGIINQRCDYGASDIPLDDCLGRILDRDICAQLTHPPFNAAAMDGYAVRFQDVRARNARLQIIGEVAAGEIFDSKVSADEAVRISTGGIVPRGADHILLQEHAIRNGLEITITEPQPTARHIRKAGLDFKQGDLLMTKRTRIAPPHIAIAAAANHPTLQVKHKPTIAVIANGNELQLPGSKPSAGHIISSNQFVICALVRSWGAEAYQAGIARDCVTSINAMIDKASGADIIVTIGGASVGPHDHVRQTFVDRGLQLGFSSVCMRPGKPTWFGYMGDQRVLGLPGNPAAAYISASIFLPVLLDLADGLDMVSAVLDMPVSANKNVESFLGAKLRHDNTSVRVELDHRQDTSLISPFLNVDCLLRRAPNAPALEQGETVEVLRLK